MRCETGLGSDRHRLLTTEGAAEEIKRRRTREMLRTRKRTAKVATKIRVLRVWGETQHLPASRTEAGKRSAFEVAFSRILILASAADSAALCRVMAPRYFPPHLSPAPNRWSYKIT